MFVTGLDRVLRNAAVEFEGVDGWESRSLNTAGLAGSIKACMWHTTETADAAFDGRNFPTLDYVTSGLGYPLYNLLIGRNGHVRIIAAGSAAHAGNGAGGGMARDNANREALAVSFDANESDNPVNAAQLDTAARIGKALSDDWSGNLTHIMHGEWSDERHDPTGIPGGWDALREAISAGRWPEDGAEPAGGAGQPPPDSGGSGSLPTASLTSWPASALEVQDFSAGTYWLRLSDDSSAPIVPDTYRHALVVALHGAGFEYKERSQQGAWRQIRDWLRGQHGYNTATQRRAVARDFQRYLTGQGVYTGAIDGYLGPQSIWGITTWLNRIRGAYT